MKTWKMRLICQGKNQNVKYVIGLKSPLHVRSIRQRDVNATHQVTDGQRFVSPIAKRVHKGYKFCTDVLRGCSVWSRSTEGTSPLYRSAHHNFALLMAQQELLVGNVKLNIEGKQRFDVHVTVYCDTFLIIKPTRCTNFSNLFSEWNSTCFEQLFCPWSGVFNCTYSNVAGPSGRAV